MNWKPTLSFRRFSNKHYELNRLYWTQLLGNKALLRQIDGKPETDLTITHINPALSFTKHMHTVGETKRWADEYLKRSRLHLLVICAANLETYLQDITFWHTADLGYFDRSSFKLSPVGQAMAKPILGRASLPEPLKYAEHYFKVNFGKDLPLWRRFYKLRSAAAHNGGIATGRTVREIPDLTISINEPIGLEWDELKDALGAAERIAKKIDQLVSTKPLRLLEVERELRELQTVRKLPNKKDLWSFVHAQYGLKGLKAKEKQLLVELLYP